MAGAKPELSLSPRVQRLAALPIPMVMATKRADGRVQLNPIWFEHIDGAIWVNSNTHRSWPKHLQRDKEAALLLVDPAEPDRYAQIHARLVEVIPDPKHEFIDRLQVSLARTNDELARIYFIGHSAPQLDATPLVAL